MGKVVVAWTFAGLLLITGLVMFVGIFTFPLGLLCWYLAYRIAGKSFQKYWLKLDAIKEAQKNHREAACLLDDVTSVDDEELPWLI